MFEFVTVHYVICDYGFHQRTGDISEPDSQAANVQPELRMALPAAEIARYGLIHNPVLLIFPIAAYFLATERTD